MRRQGQEPIPRCGSGPQLLVRLFALLDLGLERLRLLLQERDRAQALLFITQRRVALRRDHTRVDGADRSYGLTVAHPAKEGQRVGAPQSERVGLEQVIPEVFEPECSL